MCCALDDYPTVLHVYTIGLAYDAMTKTGTTFTAESYDGLTVKTFITASKAPFWDPLDYEPT